MTDVEAPRGPRAEHPDLMVSVEEYFDQDTRSVPKIAYERSRRTDLPSPKVPVDSFTSKDYAKLEFDRLWMRVWQMACREREVAPGAHFEYTIGDQSAVIVRSEDGVLRAFHNVCPHRGTRLIEGCAEAAELSCPFHGWSWNLDGSLKKIPTRWDFPSVDDDDVALIELPLGTWNGFVFINFDKDCEPLSDFIGPTVSRHFEQWPYDRRAKVVHLARPFRCNWKVAFQAFVEVYHAFRTHPETAMYTADANAEYDQFGLHSREVVAMGVPSPHVEQDLDTATVVEAMIRDTLASGGQFDPNIEHLLPGADDDRTSRVILADFVRGFLKDRTGVDYEATSDSEMLDIYQYFLFPNFVPWGGFGFPLVYRVRPYGDDPDMCLWEIMLMVTIPDGVDLPPDVPMRMLGIDEEWADAPELGASGYVFDQDTSNMERLQRGMKSRALDEIVLAEYQESTIRQFFVNLEKYVGGLTANDAAAAGEPAVPKGESH